MSAQIHFRYRHRRGEFELLVDSQVPGKGVTALFGRSGSGKTSLLRCLAGLERPDEAYLAIGDEVLHDSRSGHFVPPEERGFGYVFQEGALFPHLSVAANLAYGLKRTPAAQQRQALAPVVELLGLGPLMQQYPAQLSGGEKQRVAIGRALLSSPRTLLMDEPLAALDRQHKNEILPYLERLHREVALPVLYITHDPQEMTRIADHLLLLDSGRVIAQGPLDEVLARPELPLSRTEDAAVAVTATVIAQETEFDLTRLAFSGGELLVGRIDAPVTSQVRVQIHARDVSLALTPPAQSSILNILPARVVALESHDRGRMVVRLDLEGTAILARITRKSAAQLAVREGSQLFAQIKGVSLLA
ncbi:molybdenum ABC transporter ATP-binding protein [Motiliproteus sp. SC1-56]|uniref:molybdenum ABC transporter ATP-binding protein n=1 Tax=Motiliproteus sp. SC1-56 TaxID=2799565 RepID=UPI001A8C3F7E